MEAPAKIGEYFQYKSLYLEPIADPEILHGIRLNIDIITDLEAEQALDNLDKLYDAWWLDISDNVQEKLEIDVDWN